MVDKARVENSDIVWLSSNCCDLTPAPQRRQPPQNLAPVPENKVHEQAAPRPRLLELLRRKRRAG